jgi:uncharacterized protein YjgD (DUF1641 family)
MAMTENNLQEQISELNRKLDLVLENVEEQKRNREQFDDLVQDVNIVAKDAFQQTVIMLDKAQVDLDSGILSGLIIKVLQNIGTFHEMLEMMESIRDFMKDASPILHQVGLDAVNKMNELDEKGYFEYFREMGNLAETWMQTFTVEDMKRFRESLPHLAGLLRNVTDPSLMASLNNATRALAEIKMDDRTDNKSLWQLFRELKSPEVRKSLSYSLRLLKEINQSPSEIR